MVTAWQQHLTQYRIDHPEIRGKAVLTAASATYTKVEKVKVPKETKEVKVKTKSTIVADVEKKIKKMRKVKTVEPVHEPEPESEPEPEEPVKKMKKVRIKKCNTEM
jgi:hypothetical protein